MSDTRIPEARIKELLENTTSGECEWCVDGLQADGETPCPCSVTETTEYQTALAQVVAERDRLREALEPFADVADLFDSEVSGHAMTDELELSYAGRVTLYTWPLERFYAARAALEATMTEIVKVQRPMLTVGQHEPTWLIYAKGHKHMNEVPESLIPQHVKDAMGDDFKAYFEGAWSSIVGWGLSNRVSDYQDF